MKYLYFHVAFSFIWGDPGSPQLDAGPGYYVIGEGGTGSIEPLQLHWSEEYGFWISSEVSFDVTASEPSTQNTVWE